MLLDGVWRFSREGERVCGFLDLISAFRSVLTSCASSAPSLDVSSDLSSVASSDLGSVHRLAIRSQFSCLASISGPRF